MFFLLLVSLCHLYRSTVYYYIVIFLMIRLPPRSTRTDTLFTYTTLFRSAPSVPPTLRLQGRKICKFGIASCGPLRVVESRTRGQISMLHCRTMTVMLPKIGRAHV